MSGRKFEKKRFWITVVFEKYWTPNFQHIFVLSITLVWNDFQLCHMRWSHFMTSYVISDFFSFLANFGAILWLKYSWVFKNCYLCYPTTILHLSWKFQLCSTYHSKIIDRKLAKFSENWKISQKTEKIVFVIALEFEKQSTPNFQNISILAKTLI